MLTSNLILNFNYRRLVVLIVQSFVNEIESAYVVISQGVGGLLYKVKYFLF